MSIELMVRAWKIPCESHTQKLVLLALADNANDNGICWPSVTNLAGKCSLTERGVQKQLVKLLRRELITRKSRSKDGLRTSNTYSVLTENPMKSDTNGVQGVVNTVRGGGERCSGGVVNTVHTDPPVLTINEPRKGIKADPSKAPTLKSGCETELPRALDLPEFRKAWQEWVQHRAEIKKKMTPTATSRQLASLAKWGTERAIAALYYSIANGWQGIFEPKAAKKEEQPAFRL